MILRILKKDLKRKKTMNIILLLFIILATMFVASGINDVITVINGTDYYLDKAGVGAYALISMTDDASDTMEEALSREKAVLSYRVENVIFGSQSNVRLSNGEQAKTKNATIFQSLNGSAISFFDAENKEPTALEKGHLYVSGNFMEENGLVPGDSILIEHCDVKMRLILDGKVKDAFLGSGFIGNTRFLLSDQDIQTLLEDETVNSRYQGQIGYIEADDISTIASTVSSRLNVMFQGSRSTLKLCYVMDMLVAFVILILSVCLMIVSFVVLKFSITVTITEEYREIGVMKAIGITDAKIRRLYIIKYVTMALVGAAIGFFASIPFGNLLLESVTENMVLGNDMGLWANAAGAAIVILAIVLFAYLCTKKVEKLTPVDAVRSGQTGERYRAKTIYRIGKSHVGASLYLAVNDVVSSPKRFATVIISFLICTLFVLMLVNTTATMKSPNLITTFVTRSDLYVTDIEEAMKNMNGGNKSDMEELLRQKGEELKRQGMPAVFRVDVQYVNTVTCKGKDYPVTCLQGIGIKADDYEYMEGSVPQNKNEIAITPQISELIGAEIGDTVTIDYGAEKQDCIVTAYFQSMSQLGKAIRLHEDAPADFAKVASMQAFQIDFTDDPSPEEIEIRKEKIKKLYGNDKVMNATEYCVDCIGVVDTMEAVQTFLLAITLVVVLLVTILMERSFIADEISQIAILKAVGFKDRAVILWHVCRFGLAAVISVLLAAVVSIPMTNLCITPVFGMMGAARITYNIDPLQIFIIYPGIVFLMTVLTAAVTALYTKTIKSSDTADIE